MVDSSVTSQRTTKRRFDSLSCSCCDDDADDEENDDEDEEKTSFRIAALAAARSECRVVARIGMDERDVRRRR